MGHAHRTLETPIGRYTLVATRDGLSHVQPEGSASLPADDAHAADPAARRHLDAAEAALDDYFAGRRRDFDDLALAPSGSAFQKQVWRALRRVPFGTTASYGEIARRIGRAGAARAIGGANHDNPLGIVVPCHRVIGADGRLTGYAGGLERKRWLLSHEGALLS
ncbi:MAG: methylated-DNA--[protein]-cysteine S-methyltransferase [Myxococcota bacterium]